MRSPLARFKAANRLIKAYRRGNDTDAAALEALEQCIGALCLQNEQLRPLVAGWDGAGATCQQQQQQSSKKQRRESSPVPPAAVHSLDLDLDDPAFLTASALLALGLLRESRDELPAARAALGAALSVFPCYVAALAAAARAVLAGAGTDAELEAGEQLLSRAVTAAEKLAADEDGLVAESNKACKREVEAGAAARAALAMLLCQAGRDGEAAPHLTALGFSWRLSSSILCYPQPGSPARHNSGSAACSINGGGTMAHGRLPLAVLDGALPRLMLGRLQRAFAPDSPFWRQHAYGPRQGYFSYMFPLEGAPASILSQLAHHLRALALPHFPEVAEARYAEWWAHCRRHNSGHQLHFDSDDEGTGGVRNPVISSVCYLSSSPEQTRAEVSPAPGGSGGADGGGAGVGGLFVGGPTLVTDQRLGGQLAVKGWLAFPAANRVTLFDGGVLHGVIPGRGPSPDPSCRRCTLMVAFWRDLRCRPTTDGQLGASMPMPELPAAGDGAAEHGAANGPAASTDAAAAAAATGAAEDGGSWLELLRRLSEDELKGSSCEGSPAPSVVEPTPVPAVWEPVNAGCKQRAPSYDACFQGF